MSRKGQIVYGLHAVRAAVRYDPAHIVEAWVEHSRRDGRMQRLRSQLEGLACPVNAVSARELDRIANGRAHQGVVVRYAGLPPLSEEDLAGLLERLEHPPLLLVLDQIQDPHNLGACLRTADGAGVDGVIAPRDHAAGLTPVVHKVASGAAQRVPFVQVTNLARTLRWLKERGVWLVGAGDRAETTLYQADLTGPMALVLGAEDTGMRRLTREACDTVVRIPMLGGVSSLNVSVATGVLLYEALRQRQAAA